MRAQTCTGRTAREERGDTDKEPPGAGVEQEVTEVSRKKKKESVCLAIYKISSFKPTDIFKARWPWFEDRGRLH